jgi:hypothetical protein
MVMDQDTLDKLASGEYSISPNSGRLRKRIRRKKTKGFFKRTSVKNFINSALWVILLAAFLISLILVFPELNIVSDKKKIEEKSSSK